MSEESGKKSKYFNLAIPTQIWEQARMYFVEDNVNNFNDFVAKLFKVGVDKSQFNRNPIIHRTNIKYHSEGHSLRFILTLLEMRLFSLWKKQINAFPSIIPQKISHLLMGQEIKIGNRFTIEAITNY